MLRKIRPCFWLILLFVGSTVFAENKGPQTIPELQQQIEKVLRETHTPGAAVAIVSRDKVEWMAGLGLADEAANKPVTTKTLFRIGSVSKEFVALAALKLQEEGKLKLTDTLSQWVPEYAVKNAWESTDPVRLVHLMEHTSGLPDLRFNEYAHNDPTPVTLAQALAFAPQYRVVRWRPGSRYAYSGAGALATFFANLLTKKIAAFTVSAALGATITTMAWAKFVPGAKDPEMSALRSENARLTEGWKYAITEKRVDDYIAENNVKAQAAR